MKENDNKDGVSKEDFDGMLKKLLNVPPPDKMKRHKDLRNSFDFALTQQLMFQSSIAPSKLYILMGVEMTQEDLNEAKIPLVLPEDAECYKGEMHVIENDQVVEVKNIVYTITNKEDKLYLQFGIDEPMELIAHSPKDRSFTFKHPKLGEIVFSQFKSK